MRPGDKFSLRLAWANDDVPVVFTGEGDYFGERRYAFKVEGDPVMIMLTDEMIGDLTPRNKEGSG